MKTCFATRAVLALVLTTASTLASAQVFQFDGRYYEVVPSDGISWSQANAAASIRPHPAGLDIAAHLVTIHSEGEELAIQSNLAAPQGNRSDYWVGATKGNCSGATGCFGRWNNGGLNLGQGGGLLLDHDNLVGPFSREFPYANWKTAQPDGSNNAQTVSYGPGADGFYGLDDNSRTNVILGYVVEWGDSSTPHSGEACLAGCNLPEGSVAGSIFKYPPGTIVAGKQVDVSSWVVQDDASRCGRPDSNFNKVVDAGEGTPLPVDLNGIPGPEVILSGFTCAHPDVGQVVIFKTTSDVVPNGTVEVENFTSNLLPSAYKCDAKIPRNVPPTHQAIGLWQYDDLSLMQEDESAELTFACGTDRLKGGRGSYWVVGASINCGPTTDEYTCFLQVALYKLHWALTAVQQAGSEGAMTGGDLSSALQQLNTAIADLTKGNITECRKHVVNFNKIARAATYSPSVSGINFKAEFEARGDNLIFTLAKLTAAKQFVAQ